MIGLRRMALENDAEALRIARGTRLGQAPKDDYAHAVAAAEAAMELG